MDQSVIGIIDECLLDLLLFDEGEVLELSQDVPVGVVV